MKQTEMQGKKSTILSFQEKIPIKKEKKKNYEKQKQYLQLTHLDTSCGVIIVLHPK